MQHIAVKVKEGSLRSFVLASSAASYCLEAKVAKDCTIKYFNDEDAFIRYATTKERGGASFFAENYADVMSDEVEVKVGDSVIISFGALVSSSEDEDSFIVPIDSIYAIRRADGTVLSINGWVLIKPDFQAKDLSFKGDDRYIKKVTGKIAFPQQHIHKFFHNIDFKSEQIEVGSKVVFDLRQTINLTWLGQKVLGCRNLVAVRAHFIFGVKKPKL